MKVYVNLILPTVKVKGKIEILVIVFLLSLNKFNKSLHVKGFDNDVMINIYIYTSIT